MYYICIVFIIYRMESSHPCSLNRMLFQAASSYSKSLLSGTKQLGGGGSGEGEITLRCGEYFYL